MRLTGEPFSSAAVSLDSPRPPASPESSNDLAFAASTALDQRRKQQSRLLSSRPTRSGSGQSRLPLEATLHRHSARSAAQAGAGLNDALEVLRPRSSSSNRSPRSLRVLSAITTILGFATPCRRAARFGVLPIILRSPELLIRSGRRPPPAQSQYRPGFAS